MFAALIQTDKNKKRLRLGIQGVVQGVGFRPFVYSVAQKLDIKGFIGNESSGVFIEIEGNEKHLENFQTFLKENLPPLAHISEIKIVEIETRNDSDFRIVESERCDADFTLISPDICVCADCRSEFFDNKNRRFQYPFINCTNCGPRFTITEKIPYDRPNTTMREFEMCEECQKEYDNPANRRFHAQPNACPKCGPHVYFIGKDGANLEKEVAIKETKNRLKNGEIVAVKGIGGFHLVCDARNDEALRILRERKNRVDKPFAVMCKDSETAKNLFEIGDAEKEILESIARPVVLLKKKTNDLSELIAPNNQFLGLMLPYSPLHFLLFDDEIDVLVMTSGNFSNEPIVKDNVEAFEKLGNLADSFLMHNRDIFVQCDDTVVRIWDCGFGIADSEKSKPKTQNPKTENQILPIRRSRGFSPFPVELPFAVPQILAVGGELKSAFCLTRENFAFMSQHIGDMENLETLESFERSFEQMKNLFHVEPEIIVGDLHPKYLSTNWAETKFAKDKKFVKVQHHHAHIASVMVENGVKDEKVIGFAFDGTGFGTDGKIWGGEVLIADYEGFERAAQLKYFPLAGGDVSVKNVYRQALSLLRECGIEWTEDLQCVKFCTETERGILRKQLENNLNTVETSSFGRLFDAVSSIANVRQKATYEAQAAIEFESLLDETVSDFYKFDLIENETILIDYRNLIESLVEDVRKNLDVSIISAKFHNAVAELILFLSLKFRSKFNLNKVALSGGCFQNVSLLKKAVNLLNRNDFEVLIHSKVPPNDGGLALGQAVIAARQIKFKS